MDASDVGAAVRGFDALDSEYSARFRAILEDPDLRSSWVRIVGQERIGSADIRFAFDSVDEVDGFSETQGFVTASRVNRRFPDDWNDPYTPGTIVVRAETSSTRDFVRLHRDGNQAGGFIAKREQVEGLSSSELRDKFSLSYEPTYVSNVEVPEGTTIRVGQVNSNFGGSAGAIQYELVDDLPPGSFTNQRELPI